MALKFDVLTGEQMKEVTQLQLEISKIDKIIDVAQGEITAFENSKQAKLKELQAPIDVIRGEINNFIEAYQTKLNNLRIEKNKRLIALKEITLNYVEI